MTLHDIWWFGRMIARRAHELAWYQNSISQYSDDERRVFMEGYNSTANVCPYKYHVSQRRTQRRTK
jgi:hypothetical protein